MGGGVEVDRLRNCAEERGLRNVVFLPPMPMTEIGTLLKAADALLVHLRSDPLFRITIPSKTQAYMVAGRPIIMGVDGDAAELVLQSGGGVVAESQNAEALASAARQLASLDGSQRSEMGRRASEYYRENLALSVGVGRFSEIFRRFSNERNEHETLLRSSAVINGFGDSCDSNASSDLAGALKLGKPAFFRQLRPGIKGVPFEMIKFRSMTDKRGDNGQLLPDRDRLVPFGRFLRATSLDELPELWNVLKGI